MACSVRLCHVNLGSHSVRGCLSVRGWHAQLESDCVRGCQR